MTPGVHEDFCSSIFLPTWNDPAINFYQSNKLYQSKDFVSEAEYIIPGSIRETNSVGDIY